MDMDWFQVEYRQIEPFEPLIQNRPGNWSKCLLTDYLVNPGLIGTEVIDQAPNLIYTSKITAKVKDLIMYLDWD